jgi:transposase
MPALIIEGRTTAMEIATLGLDLGKRVVHVVGLDRAGSIVLRRRVSRDRVLTLTANLPRCVIGLEACCGAHHLGRNLTAQGHEVRLMPPEYVRPYVKNNKNDYRDGEAAAEAAGRPTMRFVPLKGEAQLDLQSLHRIREGLVARRTALINQVRALLLERGIAMPQGRRKLEQRLPEILADETAGLSPRMRHLVADLQAEWRALDRRIAELDAEFVAYARQDEACRRLIEIPGIGATIATALVAAVGRGRAFEAGRDMAAWLGLVPRQRSTGGVPRLLGISKRGNKYLRKLLVHGARAALPHLAQQPHPLGRWLAGLLARAHRNVAVVALANKLARIAWAVLSGNRRYAARAAAAA